MYFVVCPTCGAHLDPGEECEDCREKKQELAEKAAEMTKMFVIEKNGQMRLAF